jgi:hypothetical protein
MSEKTMWTRAAKALGGLDPIRVENPARAGTPDVNYGGWDRFSDTHVEGWIELKWLRRWPVNAGTVVQVPHFTPQQRSWLLRRHARGGRVHLLLKVDVSWLLFTGDVAAKVLGRVDRRELWEAACGHWPRGLQEMELRKCILTTR